MAQLSSLRDRIRKIFCEKLHIDPAADEVNLFEDGALDSLMFIDLLLHLEQDFGVKITLENLEIEHFNSVAKIAEFIAAANGQKDGRSVPPT